MATQHPRSGRRRGWVGWALVVAFVVLPLTEIYVLIQVGHVIGVWWTILLLVADSVLGAWLARREGARAWAALRVAVASGRMPQRELADAALVLVGGTLLLTPGFVSDVVGMLFLLPLTRPLARRLLAWLVARRVTASLGGAGGGGAGPTVFGRFGAPTGPRTPPGSSGAAARRPGTGRGTDGRRPGPEVVRGDVVDRQ